MDSDLHHHNPPPQQIMNSGLTRYRSAPSSYFSNLINNGIYGDEDVDPFFNPSVSSPETERILSRFGSGGHVNSNSHHNFGQIGGNEPQFLDSTNHEQKIYSSQSPQQHQQQQPTIYGKLAQSQESGHNGNRVVSRSMDDPLMAMNHPTNLLRQSSSPAGFFDHINIDKGFSVTTSMDNSSFPSSKRLKTQMGFSSPSSSSPLSCIPETKGKTSLHGSSWDESTILTNSFLNELEESDQNAFPNLGPSKNHNNEGRIHAPTMLTHHLSLPTSSSEVSAMENLLQFQDSVPLQSRAKRGCATHPRSIAERVRRTRISERMRKLQDLVPNMDKQTNTADMLDLAVDYIKELQKQVETLSGRREKCTCRNEEKL